MKYRVKWKPKDGSATRDFGELDLGREPLKIGNRVSFQHQGQVYQGTVRQVVPLHHEHSQAVPEVLIAET